MLRNDQIRAEAYRESSQEQIGDGGHPEDTAGKE